MKIFTEVFGWCGAIMIVFGYALLSFGVLDASNILYHLLNLVGSIGIVFTSVYKKNYAPGFLNGVYAAIAVVAVATLLF